MRGLPRKRRVLAEQKLKEPFFNGLATQCVAPTPKECSIQCKLLLMLVLLLLVLPLLLQLLPLQLLRILQLL